MWSQLCVFLWTLSVLFLYPLQFLCVSVPNTYKHFLPWTPVNIPWWHTDRHFSLSSHSLLKSFHCHPQSCNNLLTDVAAPTSTPSTGDSNSWYSPKISHLFLSLHIILCPILTFFSHYIPNYVPASLCRQDVLSFFYPLSAISPSPSLFSATH